MALPLTHLNVNGPSKKLTEGRACAVDAICIGVIKYSYLMSLFASVQLFYDVGPYQVKDCRFVCGNNRGAKHESLVVLIELEKL